ncbi:hypothetical protein [Nocardia terpenica]|uniref:Uncharacterized protein n=1 Tax=Nocardia terpenica TaxID=455432 RepID=A0A164HUG7_9NOCA|nr:hypothetical protein [Nocardia terpenica]KZM68825.1 hypothetical protein AWN90_13630 [Nocardia terpenica]NQE88134.1 hypothetical protein [Nocardia terpenica]
MSLSEILEQVGVIAGSGAVGAGVTGWANRRKSRAETTQIDAEAAKIIADTAVVLVAPLAAQVEGLNTRVAVLETENRRTKGLLRIALDHIEELHDWIKSHVPGAQPPSRPASLPDQEAL